MRTRPPARDLDSEKTHGLTRHTGNISGGSGCLIHADSGRFIGDPGDNVVELHGTLCAWRCTTTGDVVEPGPETFSEHPPRSASGAPMRPNVVWFGEMLPESALDQAFRALESTDLFLSIGTSAVVHPAAGFADMARSAGARTLEVNRDPTPISDRVDCSLMGRSKRSMILP